MRRILLSLLLAAISFSGFAGVYGGGSGSSGDPYLISTPANLVELSNTPADWKWKTYKLTADIDMTGYAFTPIGNSTDKFESTLDGNYHKISNLTVTPTGTNDGTGLIGFLGGTVKNLGIVNVNLNVPGTNRVAPIAGIFGWGTIENCYSEGGIINVGGGGWAGGIVGVAFNGSSGNVSNCYSSVAISAGWASAGIFGDNKGTTSITNVAFFGTLNNGMAISNINGGVNPVNAYYKSSAGVTDPNGTMIQDTNLVKKNFYPGFDFSNIWRIDYTKGHAALHFAMSKIKVYLDADGSLTLTPQAVNTAGGLNLGSNLTGIATSSYDCNDVSDSLCIEKDPNYVENWIYFKNSAGQNDTCEVHLTILDTVSPTAACVSQITVNLSDAGGNGMVALDLSDINNGSSDACGIKEMTLDVSELGCSDVNQNIAGDSLNPNTVVTLQVEDVHCNTASCTATVVVVDDEAPIAKCQDMTILLDPSGNATVTAQTSGVGVYAFDKGSTDNCGIDTMTVSGKTNYTIADVGLSSVLTLSVTDVNGNASSCSASVLLGDAIPPEVFCNPLTVDINEDGEYVLSDTEITQMAAGTTANPTSDNDTPFEELGLDVFPKSFDCVQAGTVVSVTVFVSDKSGNITTCETTVTVNDNVAPEALCKNTTVTLDADGNAEIYPALIDNGSNDNCEIESRVLSQTNFSCADVGTQNVTLSVIDKQGNAANCTAEVVVNDLIAPQFMPVADIEIEVDPGVCETTIDYPELTVNDNCEPVLSLTAGLGENGNFPIGTTTETWVATDAQGNTDEISFTVTVTTTNALPTIDAIADVAVDEDAPAVTIDLSGISFGVDCQSQEVSIAATVDNTALVNSVTSNYTDGNSTGTIELTFAPDKNGTAMLEVSVTDSEGGVTTQNVSITVNPVNDAPVVVGEIANQTVNASFEKTIEISAQNGVLFDDIDDNVLNLDLMLKDGSALPAWMSFDSGVLTVKPMIADTGSYTIVVTAKDAAGESAKIEFTLVVDGYPTGISTLSSNVFELNMYPNPSRGNVFIDLNQKNSESVELTVFEITGRAVLNKTFAPGEKIKFDMSGQNSGMYLVQLEIQGENIIRKLIVDKQ